MAIKLRLKGDFSKTNKYLEKLLEKAKLGILDKYAKLGVNALSSATPVRTGKTAASWYYEIEHDDNGATIIWNNSNTAGNTSIPVALLIQYGHGTRLGGYVQGVDYINPAIQPVIEKIAEDCWKEITRL